MFKRIVVPLDGSRQAEAALPFALTFARHFNSELVLFKPLDGTGNQPVSNEMSRPETQNYLNTLKRIITDPKVVLSHDPAKIKTIEVTGSQEEAICRYIFSDKNVLLISSKGLPFIARALAANYLSEKPYCYLEVPSPDFTADSWNKSSMILDKLNTYPQFPFISKVGVIVDPLSESLEEISVAAKLAGSLKAAFYLLSTRWSLNNGGDSTHPFYSKLVTGDYLTISKGSFDLTRKGEAVRFENGETLNNVLNRNGIRTVIGCKLDETGLPVHSDFLSPGGASIIVTSAGHPLQDAWSHLDKLHLGYSQLPVIYINANKAEGGDNDSSVVKLYPTYKPATARESSFNQDYSYRFSFSSRKTY